MTRSRLAASGLLALVFALGALVGGAATMLADRARHGDRFGDRPSFVQTLKEELTLTADQEQRIIGILDRHQPAMDSIWGIVRNQFEAERQTVRNEIRSLLEPDQVKKYEVLIARRDSVRRARGALHGGR